MRLAYSPIIPLVESHVAIYKIYVLKNPLRNNEIFYVGQTSKDLEERLSGHISQTGSNREKINYIKEIIDAESRPLIESIEVISGTCYIDKIMVNERELYWIKYYKALGCKLLNLSGINENAKCHEYHHYLSSIKRGESSAHYYYCDKTKSGDEVYDENKLKMDGFILFPEKPVYSYSESINYYNPWENERFVKKLGFSDLSDALKNAGTNIKFDTSVYDDLNPDIYEQDNCTLFGIY